MMAYEAPNFGNALVRGMQMRGMVEEGQQRQRRRDLAPDVQAAIGGDSGALGRVAAVDPDYALKIGPVLDRLDANKRAVVKQAADFTVQAGMGLLNTPPELRSQAYQEARAEAQRRGIPTDTWPTEWGPRAEGFMSFNVGKARDVNKYLDEKAKTERETAALPVPMPGYGGAPTGGGGAPQGAPPNRDQFVQTIMPYALEVSKRTGLDPRLIIAQAAHESGWGASAPGNNYFGIKSHGQPGGQVLPTTEAGPGGTYRTQDSFRSYPSVAASVQDYGNFIQGNSRYQPVLSAQGVDAQIDAMGKSGYATDPDYAAKLRRIVQSLPPIGPQPTMGTPPPAMVAQGANAAPMPNAPAGLIPNGPPPANMPEPRVAQAQYTGPQGDMVAPGMPGGPPQAQPDPRTMTSGLPPGVVPLMDPRTRLPVFDSRGWMAVEFTNERDANGRARRDYVPAPKPKEQSGGPFAGNSVEAQALNMLIANGTLTPQQAAELAAGKTITDPKDGTMMFMTPSGIFKGPAQQGPAPSGQVPAGDAQTNPGMIPLTGPKPVKMTDEQAKAAGFADRMSESEKAIQKFGDAALDFGSRQLEGVPLIGNYLQTPEYRQFEQARRDFINSQLRRESGAVISDQEFSNAEKQYFPRPGDDPATIKQKAKNRALAIEGMKRSAGPSYGQSQGGGQPKVNGPAEEGRTLFEARDAIKRGADPNAVKKRLQEMGVDPGKL